MALEAVFLLVSGWAPQDMRVELAPHLQLISDYQCLSLWAPPGFWAPTFLLGRAHELWVHLDRFMMLSEVGPVEKVMGRLTGLA